MNEENVDTSKKPSKKKILFLLIIVVIFLVAFSIYFFKNNSSNVEVVSVETSEKKYSLEDVSKHNKKEDCWFVIEDGVYDVSKFVSSHPGGEIIISACGTDATQKFNNRPTTNTSHSSLARKMLQSLRVGSLIK